MYLWNAWGVFAAVMLVVWLPVAFYLFRNETPSRATNLTLLGAAMFGPVAAGFDFPLLPPMGKHEISAFAVTLAGYIYCRPRFKRARLLRGPEWLVALSMLSTMPMVWTNQDPLSFGSIITTNLPGLTIKDGAFMAVGDFYVMGLGFAVGRIFLQTMKDLRECIYLLGVAGLLYSLLALYELRMSPMLHVHVYGYFGHPDFLQSIRSGGYRPNVFMGHGLVVGMFFCLSVMALAVLKAAGRRSVWGLPTGVALGYLMVVLVMTKAWAMTFYALALVPLILWTSPKTQMRAGLLLAALVVAYPTLRASDRFPTTQLTEFAGRFSQDRADSLQFRFDNEDLLLVRALERPIFGWGGYSRERIYDPDYGKDMSIQDGQWIITLGIRGISGLFFYFGLLLLPVLRMYRAFPRIERISDRRLVAAAVLMLIICCVNLLPNGEYRLFHFFLAGGLWTMAGMLPTKQAPQSAAR